LRLRAGAGGRHPPLLVAAAAAAGDRSGDRDRRARQGAARRAEPVRIAPGRAPMSDLQQILQDLSDALPGIPEKLAALAQAAHGADEAARALSSSLQQHSSDAQAKMTEIGAHLWAIGDASSEENAQYDAAIDKYVAPQIVRGWLGAGAGTIFLNPDM